MVMLDICLYAIVSEGVADGEVEGGVAHSYWMCRYAACTTSAREAAGYSAHLSDACAKLKQQASLVEIQSSKDACFVCVSDICINTSVIF